MVGTLSGMGISTSGVLKIADAAGAGEEIRVARTVRAVRQIVLWLGLLGALLLAIFCVPLSRLTFGTAEHAGKIALLSLVIVFGAVAEGQMAVLQGFRRMSDLAKLAILGTTASAVLTLPIVYFWPQNAVVALLLVASGAGHGVSLVVCAKDQDCAGFNKVARYGTGGATLAASRARLDVCWTDGCRDRVCGARRDRALSGFRSCRHTPVCDGVVERLLRVHSGGDGRLTSFRECHR